MISGHKMNSEIICIQITANPKADWIIKSGN